MSDLRAILERGVGGETPPPDGFERMLRRRDRKRRNQRITAGVVGIAVFVAAVWIVTSVKSLDRSEKVVVPATSGTTGPAETRSADPGPAWASPGGWDGYGIPPEGTRPSTPVTGNLIKVQGRFHTSKWVYADGRAIWVVKAPPRSVALNEHLLERRLTPEGVGLVRSGARLQDIPEGAWADAEPRLYVPSKYVLCFWKRGHTRSLDTSKVRDMLPAPAKDLLRGMDLDPSSGCPVVTTAFARALDNMLSKASRSPAPAHRGMAATAWFLSGDRAALVDIVPLLPHGGTVMG